MQNGLKNSFTRLLKAVIALIPWVLSMYVFYWLDYAPIWTTETPHRGKISVVILATGMLLSLLLHTRLNRRNH